MTSTAFIRGINYGAGDCDALQEAFGEEFFIPAIPLYDGKFPGADPKEKRRKYFPEEIRIAEKECAAEIAQECVRRNIRRVIAHSRGTLFIMEMGAALRKEQQRLDSLIMFPAPKHPGEIKLATGVEVEEAIDMALVPLCKGMPATIYRSMRDRHRNNFIASMRLIDPKTNFVEPEEINALMTQLNSQTPILIIDSINDPFRDPERLSRMMGSRSGITISEPFESGHFPHIHKPQELAAIIRAWEKSRSPVLSSSDIVASSSQHVIT